MDCQKPFDASDKDLDETNSRSPFAVRLEIKTKQTNERKITTVLSNNKLRGGRWARHSASLHKGV